MNEQNLRTCEYQGDEFVSNGNTGPCWNCGKLTEWVSISFETWLHPGDCADTKWAEYALAAGGAGESM